QTGVLPEQLNGLDLLVRAGEGSAAATVEAMDRIAALGGRPGLFIDDDVRALQPGFADRAAVILIEVHLGAEGIDARAFALKTALTRARAAGSSRLKLGIAATPEDASALLSRDLAPYLDFMAWLGEPVSSPQGLSVWRVAGNRASPLPDLASAVSLADP